MSAAPPAASRPSRRTASTSDRPAAAAASSTAASASASVAAAAVAPAGSTAGSKRAAQAEAHAREDAAETSSEKEQAAAGARKRARKGSTAAAAAAPSSATPAAAAASSAASSSAASSSAAAAVMVSDLAVLGGTYTGPTVNGRPEGHGRLAELDGSVYTGDFSRGKRHGIGVCRWISGRVYEGQWEDNKRVGLGAQWNSTGKLTECGQWQDDKFVEKRVVPLRLLPEGKWLSAAALKAKRDHPHDSALLPNGAHYIGPLNADGQPHGQGASIHPDGRSEITLQIDPADETNSGQWVDGVVSGRATMLFANGDRYEGQWEDGTHEGVGVFSWPDESRYEGEWTANKRNGLGAQWDKEGKRTHCGRWADGKFVVECVVPIRCIPEGKQLSIAALQAKHDHPRASALLPSGSHYIGQLNAQGQPDGRGASFHPDGTPEIMLRVDAGANLSGQWVDGRVNGRATQMLSNGICYSGLFKDSGFEGLGVYVWPTGERFEGEFSAGKFNGFGAQWNSQGTLSKCGRWEDDKLVAPGAVPLCCIPEGTHLSAAALQAKREHPKASALLPDGNHYVGRLNAHGQPHGLGSLYHPDGSPRVTLQVDPSDASTSGRWVNGNLNGRATLLASHGSRYDGLFKASRRQGLGVYRGKNGLHFEGEWVAGKQSGLGSQWDKDGKLENSGRWTDGNIVASCAVPVRLLPTSRWLSAHAKTASLLFPDGGYFVGPLNAQNQRHGEGSMFSASGDLLSSGVWSHDQLQSGAASSVSDATDTMGEPAAIPDAVAPSASSASVVSSPYVISAAASISPTAASAAAASASASAASSVSASASAFTPSSAVSSATASASVFAAASTAAASASPASAASPTTAALTNEQLQSSSVSAQIAPAAANSAAFASPAASSSSSSSSSSAVPLPLQCSNRKALIIGNSVYDAPVLSLACCNNDAEDMESALRQLGFQCTRVLNMTHKRLNAALREFIQSLQPNDIVFFHYAGHGQESGGTTYLLPTDYGHSKSLEDDAVSLNNIMQRLNRKDCDLINIIVLDCCRANAQDDTFRGSDEIMRSAMSSPDDRGGQSFVRAPTNGHFFIAYSSDPGTVAFETKGRRNGWFTECLLDYLKQPYLRLSDVFHHTADVLRKKSQGRQRAWISQTPGIMLANLTLCLQS